MTRAEVIADVVARANRFGRTWTAAELCWCGLPLDRHVELGCNAFLVTEHGPGSPAPACVLSWDPWSIPPSWMAL